MRPRLRHLALDGWVLLVVGVLTWPMLLHAGYGLARDMVFTPVSPLGTAQLGFADGPARAVPLDAVLGVTTHAVGGQVVFRLAIWGVLIVAGCGAHRSVRHLPAASRALVAVFAVWNPFVVERLALGQWALLASYAAGWWLVGAVRRWTDVGGWAALGGLVALLGLASLTPTGGLLAVLLVACLAVGRGERRRRGAALLLSLGWQLPWLLPSLWGSGTTLSDPQGVTAFASRAEHPGGVLASLLSTGGSWDPFVVPGSQGSVLGVALCVVVCVGLVVGGRRQPRGLWIAAATGLLLALLPHLPGGDPALRWVVSTIPGGGLLRDSQKWLVPFVVLAGRCLGEASHVLSRAIRRRDDAVAVVLAWVVVVLPLVLMPDAASVTTGALRPVTYPAGLARAVDVLDRAGGGDVAVLPWRSYRVFTWGNPVSVADPLPRWTTHQAVVSDQLATASGLLAGEDPHAAAVGALVGRGLAPGPLLAGGVGWVLVYADQPGAAALATSRLTPVVTTGEVELFRVPGTAAPSPEPGGPPTGLVLLVVVVDLAIALLTCAGLALGVVGSVRRKAVGDSPGC